MRIPLNVTRSGIFVQGATVASNDTVCSIELSPFIYGVTWHVESYRIRTNSPQTYGPSRFWLFRDFIADTNEVDSTYDGDGSTDPDAGIDLSGSQKLIAYWTGADLGSQAQITLRGTVETGRN
jgi:hypothetical protein